MNTLLSLFEYTNIDENFKHAGRIILPIGDTYELLKTIPDDVVKLVITSPPYNIGKIYEKRTELASYLEYQEHVINELVRVIKSDGSICWEVGNYVEEGEVFPLDILFYELFKKHSLKLRNRIIWRFNHGLHCTRRFSGRYETLLWFTKSEEYTFNLDPVRIPAKYPGKRHYKGRNAGLPSGNPLGKNPSDLWDFISQEWEEEVWDIPNVKSNHPEKTNHPCQFPIELVERCVLALTDEDDWVLDPYCGVGSSLLGALIHGRKAIGIDRDPDYISITKERIQALYNGTLRKRPLGKPVYEPTGREKVSQVPLEWFENKGNK